MLLLLPIRLTFRFAFLVFMTLVLTIILVRHAIGGVVISSLIVVSQPEQFISLSAAVREQGIITGVLMALAQATVG